MRPPRPEILQRFTAEGLGLPAHATLRALQCLPDGRMAVGSDYGMVLIAGDAVQPFPFPKGARREMRGVTSLAVFGGALHASTERGYFSWPYRGVAAGKGFPQDGAGGFDDLRAVFGAPNALLKGWRTHLEGGEGPGECISFCVGWQQRVFAGTLDGHLHEVNVGPVRRFESEGRGRPVRQLSMGAGHLWAAAAERLWRWDGVQWEAGGSEPYALTSDGKDRLWALAEGGLWCSQTGVFPERIPLSLERPWQLTADRDRLWVGCRGSLVVLSI